MSDKGASRVIEHVYRLVSAHEAEQQSDGQLLERFLTAQDEGAFEGLLRRHGPMVLGVCRRVLADPHDVEDAFQATFLVFVRRAGSIVKQDSVASWLYGVAHRTALQARSRRRSHDPLPD